MHQEIKTVVQEARENGSMGFRGSNKPRKEEIREMRRREDEYEGREPSENSSGDD